MDRCPRERVTLFRMLVGMFLILGLLNFFDTPNILINELRLYKKSKAYMSISV